MEQERTKTKPLRFDSSELGLKPAGLSSAPTNYVKSHGYEILLVSFGIAGLLAAGAITTGFLSVELNSETNKLVGTNNLNVPLQKLNALLAVNPLLNSARLNRARILTKMHRNAEAMKDYDFILTENPNDVEALERRAALAILLNRYDVTLADCNKLIASQKEKASEYTYADRAIAFSMLGKKQEAVDDYSSALKIKSLPGFYIGRADCYRDMRKFDEAFEDYEWVKMLNPGSGLGNLGKAQCYLLQKDFAKALQNLNQAIALEPRNAHYLIERGKLFWAMSKPNEALKDFEKAQALEPQNVEALTELLRIHTWRQEDAKALQDANRLVMAGFQTYDIFMKRAELDFKDKKLSLAGLGYARAAELKPNEIAPLLGQAKVTAEQKNYRKSLEIIDTAIKLKPGDPELFALHGHYNMLANNGMSADKDFDKAIALNASNLDAYLWRGEGLYDQKRYVSAEQDLEKVLRLDSKNVDAKFYLGLTRTAIQHMPRASVAHNSSGGDSSVIAIDSKTAALLASNDSAALASAGTSQYRSGNYGAAIKLLAKAVQLNPSATASRRVLAASLLAANYNSEAADQYQGVISQEPGNSSDMESLCRALVGAHRNEDLISSASGYLDKNPKDAKVRLLLIQAYAASGFRKKAEELCSDAIHSSTNMSELRQFEDALRNLNTNGTPLKKKLMPNDKPLPDTQG